MKTYSFKNSIIASTAIIFLVSLTIIVWYNANSRMNEEIKFAFEESELISEKLTHDIKISIDYTFDVLRVQNENISVTKSKLDRDAVNDILKTSLKNNPGFFGTYTLWEPNAFDGKDNQFVNQTGHDNTGRFIPYWTRTSSTEFLLEALLDYEVEGIGDYYQRPKKSNKECIIDPYFYPVGGKEILIISAVSPIIIAGKFQGITGVDYELAFMQNIAMDLQSKIFNAKSQIEIFSNQGIVVATTKTPESIGKSLQELKFDNAAGMVNEIQRGASGSEIIGDYLVITKSFSFGKTDYPWQVRISVPYSEIIKEGRQAVINSIIAGVFLLVVGLLIIFALVNKLTKPLTRLVEQTNKVAQGDLTVTIEITRNDEIGLLAHSMQKMVDNLKDIMGNIIDGADNISAASQQMNSTSQQLSQGANESASSVEEVSSTMEEMASNIEQNSQNSSHTEQISLKAYEGMLEVAKRAEQAVEANRTISDKIKIINEIAFQTNILALNAAVEAARAGEHGRGFAVVAAEVRKLAERSKVAADDIVSLSVKSLDLAEGAGKKMMEIMPGLEKTTKMVQEISAASSEQTNGANQINGAIQQMNTITQQNASASEELASSAEELNGQAEQLKELVSFFRVESAKSSVHSKKVETAKKALTQKQQQASLKTATKKAGGFKLHLKDDDDKSYENF